MREALQSNLGNLIETFTMSPWELGQRLLGNPWNLDNLYLENLGTVRKPWEPSGNLGNFGNLGNLEGTLGTLGTFTWHPLLGNLCDLRHLLGNLGKLLEETLTMTM